jgi:hypothetical protein
MSRGGVVVVSTFESLALSKHPRDAVFEVTRDSLPYALMGVGFVDHVDVERRVEHGDDVELMNVWYGRMPIPDSIAPIIKPHMLVWTDHSVWTQKDHTCRWKVTSHFFPHQVRCSGSIRFDQAMRGQATRVALQGEIVVDPRGVVGVPQLLEGPIVRGVEDFVCAMFPTALRDVVDGVSRYISELVPSSRNR